MAQNIIPKGNYFLVGLGIGSLIGVLFAPKSGEETREYLAEKTREGNELARKKARELRIAKLDAHYHLSVLIRLVKGVTLNQRGELQES
jgi:gas vesicle protein